MVELLNHERIAVLADFGVLVCGAGSAVCCAAIVDAEADHPGLAHYIGVRETRRVQGDYRLARGDCLSARRFVATILLWGAPIEDHCAGPADQPETHWRCSIRATTMACRIARSCPPGLAWLVRELPRHLRRAGVREHTMQRFYVDNPAGAFTFAPASQTA